MAGNGKATTGSSSKALRLRLSRRRCPDRPGTARAWPSLTRFNSPSARLPEASRPLAFAAMGVSTTVASDFAADMSSALATNISSGLAADTSGNYRRIPDAKNIGARLTDRLHNLSAEIRAVHRADGRPCLMLNRHGYQGFQSPGGLVPDDIHQSDLPESAERVTQGVFAGLT